MQTLEHITQTQLASGLLRLTPDKGYLLTDGHNTFTSATTKMLDGWSAVKN